MGWLRRLELSCLILSGGLFVVQILHACRMLSLLSRNLAWKGRILFGSAATTVCGLWRRPMFSNNSSMDPSPIDREKSVQELQTLYGEERDAIQTRLKECREILNRNDNDVF